MDLDDCRNGPAVQDLWMLLHGDRGERTIQLQRDARRLRDVSRFRLARVGVDRTALRWAAHTALQRLAGSAFGDPAFPVAFPRRPNRPTTGRCMSPIWSISGKNCTSCRWSCTERLSADDASPVGGTTPVVNRPCIRVGVESA